MSEGDCRWIVESARVLGIIPVGPRGTPTQPAPGKPETTHPQLPHPNAALAPLPPGSGPPRAAPPAPSAVPPMPARSSPGSPGGQVTRRFLAKGAHQHLRSRACV